MLKREEAEALINKKERTEWIRPFNARTESLPEVRKGHARALAGRATDGREIKDWDKRSKLLSEAAQYIDSLPKKERAEFFAHLFPQIGAAAARGWEMLQASPYQDSYNPLPFRAPRNPDWGIDRRATWLSSLLEVTYRWDQSVEVLAGWAPFLSRSETLGLLFAASIDLGGAEGNAVFQAILASGRGEHPIGGMGDHVIVALLHSPRTEGWEFIEKMLLAAQREEGLRQSILERIDCSHPGAFRRMLRLILDHDLVRFSATVRAVNVWVGYHWDSVSAGVVRATIESLLRYLDDPTARKAALKGKDPEQSYLALWCEAFQDAARALPMAVELLGHSKTEFRFVGAHLLSLLRRNEAKQAMLRVADDEDLRVSAYVLRHFSAGRHVDADAAESPSVPKDLFDRIEAMIPRYPAKPQALKPIIWPWTAGNVDQTLPLDSLFNALGEQPLTRLLPYLSRMSPDNRFILVHKIAQAKEWNADLRRTTVSLLKDASSDVRGQALQTLQRRKFKPDAAEIGVLEGLLSRKAAELRRGVISILAKQNDAEATASAARLLEKKSLSEQSAGLELLRKLKDESRSVETCQSLATQWSERNPEPETNERQLLEAIGGSAPAQPLKKDDALGLLRHEDRTWPAAPRVRKVAIHSPITAKILASLDALVHEHRAVSVQLAPKDPEKLLGDVYRFSLPSRANALQKANALHNVDAADATVDDGTSNAASPASDEPQLPLREIWEKWEASRPAELRAPDQLELLRAFVFISTALAGDATYQSNYKFHKGRFALEKRSPEAIAGIFGKEPRPQLKYPSLVESILDWLLYLHPIANTADFLLDCAETACALVPASEVERKPRQRWEDTEWRDYSSPFVVWFAQAESLLLGSRVERTPDRIHRLWMLARWIDQPRGRSGPAIARHRGSANLALLAHDHGAATDADILDQLLGQRSDEYSSRDYDVLRQLTKPKPALLAHRPRIAALVDLCRARVLEIELRRGVDGTPATGAALCLQSVWGCENLASIIKAFGRESFARTTSWVEHSKEQVLSELIRCCYPKPDETIEDLRKHFDPLNLSESRLVELAMFVPRWAQLVEEIIGWPHLADAVWWIHAHTRSAGYRDDSITTALTARTALSADDLTEGAVDVAWFHRVYDALGTKRWAAVDAAAKYASSGGGHTRARLFSEAMLGEVSKKELLTRVKQKRQQDALRALGLLPLASGAKQEADVLERYQVMVEFLRTSRQFGSQRQASEKRATEIAQENLARTAGYTDPLRLQWAMEAREVADLADGPLTVTAEDIAITLAIDPWGSIELQVTRDGKPLADLPAKWKKHKPFVALRERRTDLKRQASRIRPALERLMIRGESLTGAELPDLMKHPLVAPMLRGLILVGDGIKGYPVHNGRALQDHAGNEEALKKDELVRIAHPLDLLPASDWNAWQRDCFARERIQPFKQVFRELYVPTKAELAERTRSTRYAGHQVQPRKAMALLGGRGWVHDPDEGVRKTYHDAQLVAWLGFQEGFFTPAEVEGLTLESVVFTKRGEGFKTIDLRDVPPRVFSEVMRDLDLVVSVAHRGGVDPEASQSTIEMRESLIRETCRLLKINNVKVKAPWAQIAGHFGEYSVHLGSAVTRKMPGEMLFLIPVHAQHRGRLFLPFADDDPRSAEVLSKILLLARDQEIKDPGILDQLR